MAVRIACDSSTDLTREMYESLNVSVLPFTITLGENVHTDAVDINSEIIFDYVDKNKVLPKTSAINEYIFNEFFEKNNGEDGLVFISISSRISSSYSNAARASENFKNVHVVDSSSLSTGGGLLVLYACELRDQGLSAKEIADKLDERKKNVQASFVIDKLDYLYKGGRCSSAQRLGANLLKLHPSIVVENGSMLVHKKYRGKIEDCTTKYFEDTLNEFSNPDTKYCFITYSSATEKMLMNAKTVVENYGKFENVYVTEAGATITSHCGKNTIGLLYFNDAK